MLDPNQTVADLVLDHAECAPVLQRHRIDFCCHGQLSVKDACKTASIALEPLLEQLDAVVARRAGVRRDDPRQLSTAALIAHIIETHHDSLRNTMPFVEALARKVSMVHGDHNPKLHDLARTVAHLNQAILPHLQQEEQVLFPFLIDAADDALIARELAAMFDDHVAVGALLARIREAADDFSVPDWACASYRTLFAELEQLERSLLQHVHLENHVLMPRFVPRG